MRKKSQKELNQKSNSDRWLVSYADFMTLLFAFFTVMYATSEKNVEEAEKFQESIKKHLITAGAFGGSGQKIATGDQHNSPIEPPIPTFRRVPEMVQQSQEQLITALEKELSEEDLSQLIVDILTDDQSVKVSLAGNSLFQKNNIDFTKQAFTLLRILSRFLTTVSHPVMVEGHYVDSSLQQKEIWAKSAQRGLLVLYGLTGQNQALEKRSGLLVFGNTRPLVSENSKDHSKYNQRVDISIQFD